MFGFFQESFVGVEQRSVHVVEVGYQKGAEQAGKNIRFEVSILPGTASEIIMS